MPFTTENANVNHYPGTSKQATEDGFERFDMPPSNGTNNDARLNGRQFQCDDDAADMPEESD